METSDSECFESADEDFEYDKKTTKVQNDVKLSSNQETVADVAAKIENISVNTVEIDEKPNIPTDSSIKSSSKECGVEEKKKEAFVQRREQREQQRTKKEPKIKLGTKLGQKIDTKNVKQEIKSPPRRVDCWEPGVNYLEKETSKCELVPVPPPKREVCWEPGVDYSDNEEENKQGLFNKNIPPQIEQCWEPGMDYTEDTDHVSNKHMAVTSEPMPNKSNEDEEENLWGADDDWETVPNVKPIEKPVEVENKTSASGWGSWGNWGGVSNILSTATHGVTTLTSHVSQGITTVLESGIGVPDPEELARLHKNEQNVENSPGEEDTGPTIQTVFGLGNLVSGVSHITKLVETTSNKVLTGGLDTLEVIGKKTMEVLQEGDPGLKKKRAFLKIDQHKPVLSQLLREAKEKAEEENKLRDERHFEKKANYETLFDDNQGLVHLEALEMLSKQCDIKLETILFTFDDDRQLKEMQETMGQVKELCEIPEEDEDEQLTNVEIKEKLEAAVADLNVPISYNKLNSIWEESETWLAILNLDVCSERELHQQAIETLAHLTALSVEQYHKAGELLLIKEHRSTADEADSLVQ